MAEDHDFGFAEPLADSFDQLVEIGDEPLDGHGRARISRLNDLPAPR